MNKHTYLIMAHDDLSLLKKLIKQIDAPYNDIYLHIDSKSMISDKEITNVPTSSRIVLCPRMDVKGGGGLTSSM